MIIYNARRCGTGPLKRTCTDFATTGSRKPFSPIFAILIFETSFWPAMASKSWMASRPGSLNWIYSSNALNTDTESLGKQLDRAPNERAADFLMTRLTDKLRQIDDAAAE